MPKFIALAFLYALLYHKITDEFLCIPLQNIIISKADSHAIHQIIDVVLFPCEYSKSTFVTPSISF